jgi:hypothetical protein
MCNAACTTENFPSMNCLMTSDIQIEYKGNNYTEFFTYSKPTEELHMPLYDECKEFVNDNEFIPYAPHFSAEEGPRQLRIHSCFPKCKTNADCLTGFDFDDREHCTGDPEQDEGLICVPPTTSCETYVAKNEICFNEANTVCLNWNNVWWGILILDLL